MSRSTSSSLGDRSLRATKLCRSVADISRPASRRRRLFALRFSVKPVLEDEDFDRRVTCSRHAFVRSDGRANPNGQAIHETSRASGMLQVWICPHWPHKTTGMVIDGSAVSCQQDCCAGWFCCQNPLSSFGVTMGVQFRPRILKPPFFPYKAYPKTVLLARAARRPRMTNENAYWSSLIRCRVLPVHLN